MGDYGAVERSHKDELRRKQSQGVSFSRAKSRTIPPAVAHAQGQSAGLPLLGFRGPSPSPIDGWRWVYLPVGFYTIVASVYSPPGLRRRQSFAKIPIVQLEHHLRAC